MLQEYPSQVQPKSSSTRHHNNLVDAEEAGNILITLSNQSSSHLKPLDTCKKKDTLNHSLKRIPYRERARSDPIMLLAAAAAAIDNSNVDDFNKGRRHYERREIIIQKRPPPPTSSPYHRNSISSFDSYDSPQHYYSRNNNNHHHHSPPTSHPSSSTSDQNYALQYFSMKHNPKIKRNAMHAYITYMIYTDLAANDSSMKNKKRTTGLNEDVFNKKKKKSIMDIEEVEEEVEEKTLSSFQTMPPSPPQHPYQQLPSSTSLLPSPPPAPPSLSNNNRPHRSLTAYLWDSNHHFSASTPSSSSTSPSHTLNGHSPRNKMVLPPLAPSRSYQ